MKGYRKLRRRILTALEKLPNNLTYHGYHHTMDVLKVCNQYIRRSDLSKREVYLLRIAALAHDMGFLRSYKNHEVIGAEMVEEEMLELGFSEKDIQEVKNMIISTKPSNPSSTRLEKIICDADLDYLGRDDFLPISNSLFTELQNLGLIENYDEWMNLQISFLESHTYQTEYARKYRAPVKEKWLRKLKTEFYK